MRVPCSVTSFRALGSVLHFLSMGTVACHDIHHLSHLARATLLGLATEQIRSLSQNRIQDMYMQNHVHPYVIISAQRWIIVYICKLYLDNCISSRRSNSYNYNSVPATNLATLKAL